MCGSRFIVSAFLFAVLIQIHDVVEGVKKTHKASVPNSDIKGRLLTPDEGCGLSRKPIRRIVSGRPAKKGAWPWLALLGHKNDTGITFKCGGTLITSRHVLTAARCKNEAVDIVRLGEHDIATEDDGATDDVEIAHVVPHPEYDSELQLNDIAIVHLKHDIEFTDKIKPVCLPVSGPNKHQNFDNKNPFLVDWGLTSLGNRHSNILLQDQVSVIDKATCKEKFEQDGQHRIDAQYSERVICAGVETDNKCQYDAGSPLMMPIFQKRKFPIYQIGVTTFGYSCLGKHTPGIYASTQYFADWIVEQLKN